MFEVKFSPHKLKHAFQVEWEMQHYSKNSERKDGEASSILSTPLCINDEEAEEKLMFVKATVN